MDDMFDAAMTIQTAERKDIYRRICNLSNANVTKVMEFIDGIEEYEQNKDPFYSEINMKHLLAVKSDVEAGINMSIHDLVEVDND
jgi:hypothetical protein